MSRQEKKFKKKKLAQGAQRTRDGTGVDTCEACGEGPMVGTGRAVRLFCPPHHLGRVTGLAWEWLRPLP